MPIISIIGAIFLALGLGLGMWSLWRWWRWKHATGKIIGYAGAGGSVDDDYFPKIRVSRQPGGEVEFVSSIGGTGKPWPMGAKVKVLYRRDGEKVVGEVVSHFILWILPVCCLLIGVVLFFAKITVTN